MSVCVRSATGEDLVPVVRMWPQLFFELGGAQDGPWPARAVRWFSAHADDPENARIAVSEVDGRIVASAVGVVQRTVPNPYSPTGLGVTLSHVVTMPEHRSRGHATAVVRHVVEWADSIGADRVDLGASADGLSLHERLGFTSTSAPSLKLMLRAASSAPSP